MKKYAVAHINFYDNILTIEFVEASNWQEALFLAFPFSYDVDSFARNPAITTDIASIEKAKQEVFSCDQLFDVKELV